MIKTLLNREDALVILEMGRRFHQESQFKETPYDEQRCWALLEATVSHPNQFFIAYDDQFKGFIILQMGMQFFSGSKWAADQAFYVAPEHRGGSLATRLLKTGEAWAKERGASEFTIMHNAGIGLETAEKFYTKLGFGLSGLIFNKRLI